MIIKLKNYTTNQVLKGNPKIKIRGDDRITKLKNGTMNNSREDHRAFQKISS